MIEFWENDTRTWLYAPKFVDNPTCRMEKAQNLAEHSKVSFAGQLLDGVQYNVQSSTSGSYDVSISRNIQRRTCNCQDYTWRRRDCKHILASCMFLLYEQLWPLQFQEANQTIQKALSELAKILKEKSP